MALLHPENDLSMSVIVMGADILRELSKGSPKLIDDLLTVFLRKDKRRTEFNFYSSLEFLYTVGAIEHKHYRIHLYNRADADQADLFD